MREGRVEPDPVVDDLQDNVARLFPLGDTDPHVVGMGVLDNVGQRFLSK